MHDANGGVGRVYALPARTARAHHVDPQVIGIYLDIDFLDLRKKETHIEIMHKKEMMMLDLEKNKIKTVVKIQTILEKGR